MGKRRTKGDGSIHQKHDHPTCPPLIDGPPDEHGKPTKVRPEHKCRGRWVAQLNVSAPGAKRRRKTVYGKTQPEVRRKLHAAADQVAKGNHTTSSMKYADWLDYWYDNVMDVAPGTRKTYARQIRLYIKPELGGIRLDRLNLEHPTRLKNSMKTQAPSTQRQVHRLAGNTLHAAMERGLIVRNPFKIIRAPKGRAKPRQALSVAEYETFVSTLAERPDASRWLTAVLLGTRQGECLGLTWDRVNFDDVTFTFDRQAQRIQYRHGCDDGAPCGYKRAYRCYARALDVRPGDEYEIIESNICWVPTKSDSSERVVPIPLAVLGPLKQRNVEYQHQKLAEGFTNHGLVWAHADGSPLDDREDYWTWRGLLDDAGIDARALHAARNSAATKFLRDGVDPLVAQSILGHSDVLMTRAYQQADLTLARKALDGDVA